MATTRRPRRQLTRWHRDLERHLPHLTRPQRRTLALWTFAATLTEHSGRPPVPLSRGGPRVGSASASAVLPTGRGQARRPPLRPRRPARLRAAAAVGAPVAPAAGTRAGARPHALPRPTGGARGRRGGSRVGHSRGLGRGPGQRARRLDAALEAHARASRCRRAEADARGRGGRPGLAEHRPLRRHPVARVAPDGPADPQRLVARAERVAVDGAERAAAATRPALRGARAPLLDQAPRLHAGRRVARRLRADDRPAARAV